MLKTLLEHIRTLWRRLLELRDTPHAIAGGLAIGVFYGFMPLFGVKTLLSLVTAWLSRCSKIAAVIAVSLHDVALPFVPFMLRIQYDIGFWLLSNPHHLPPKVVLHHTKLAEMLQWTTFLRVGFPLLVGSLVIALPAALITYFVSYAIVRERMQRQLPPSS